MEDLDIPVVVVYVYARWLKGPTTSYECANRHVNDMH